MCLLILHTIWKQQVHMCLANASQLYSVDRIQVLFSNTFTFEMTENCKTKIDSQAEYWSATLRSSSWSGVLNSNALLCTVFLQDIRRVCGIYPEDRLLSFLQSKARSLWGEKRVLNGLNKYINGSEAAWKSWLLLIWYKYIRELG